MTNLQRKGFNNSFIVAWKCRWGVGKTKGHDLKLIIVPMGAKCSVMDISVMHLDLMESLTKSSLENNLAPPNSSKSLSIMGKRNLSFIEIEFRARKSTQNLQVPSFFYK